MKIFPVISSQKSNRLFGTLAPVSTFLSPGHGILAFNCWFRAGIVSASGFSFRRFCAEHWGVVHNGRANCAAWWNKNLDYDSSSLPPTLSQSQLRPSPSLSDCCGQVVPASYYLSAVEAQWLRFKTPANMQVTYVILRVKLCEGQTGRGLVRGTRSIKVLDRRRISLSHYLKSCCPWTLPLYSQR